MWRAYHCAAPDIALTSPVVPYRKGGGPECGLGYGGSVTAGAPLKFSAETSGDFFKVEFHDGHRVIGIADAAPWKVEGVRLERGLHAVFAVGVKKDETRRCSRAAFLVVE